MTILAEDLNGHMAQAVGLGLTQTVSYTASSVATTNAVAATTRVVRLVSTSDCHLAISANPTATTAGPLLPAGAVEYIRVNAGDKVAAIQRSSAGILYVTETT